MLADLKKELDDVFNRQLLDLLRNRHIFRQLDEAWKRNVSRSQAIELQGFMWQGYLAFACTVVRKMVDPNPTRSVSLRNFLSKLSQPSTLAIVCRAEFCKRYTNDLIRRKCADRDYNTVTGDQPELTCAVIKQDTKDIEDVVKPIKGFVDKVIAHSDRTQLTATLNDLDAAIDKMAAVYDRYALLVGVMVGGGVIRTEGIALHDVKPDIVKIWE